MANLWNWKYSIFFHPLHLSIIHHSVSSHHSIYPPFIFFSGNTYNTYIVCKALSSDFSLFILFFRLTFTIFPIPHLFPTCLAISDNKALLIITGLQFKLLYMINGPSLHNITLLICVQVFLLPNNWDKKEIISVIIRKGLLSLLCDMYYYI